MRNFRRHGDAIYATASPAWKAGELIVLDGIIGVAGFDTAIDAVGVLHRRGVFSLPKETGSDWGVGETIWYDTVGKVCMTASVANAALIGKAVPLAPDYAAAALSADGYGDVLLLD